MVVEDDDEHGVGAALISMLHGESVWFPTSGVLGRHMASDCRASFRIVGTGADTYEAYDVELAAKREQQPPQPIGAGGRLVPIGAASDQWRDWCDDCSAELDVGDKFCRECGLQCSSLA